jgi:hypothetical protein
LNNINIHRFFISVYKIQISDLGCQCEFPVAMWYNTNHEM